MRWRVSAEFLLTHGIGTFASLSGAWRRGRTRRLARRLRPPHFRLAVEPLEDRSLLAAMTFTVNSLSDAAAPPLGETTLRSAIEAANLNINDPGEQDTIEFSLPGVGPHIISLDSALTITDPVVIDGTTQPDAEPGSPEIELDGFFAGSSDGLFFTVDAAGSTVRGLAIYGFEGAGIYVDGGGGHTFEDNTIGTDAFGSFDIGNLGDGIYLLDSAGNLIQRNVLSGNVGNGIVIDGAGSFGNLVQANFIGTDSFGLGPWNNGSGVVIWGGAHDNVIGTDGDGTNDGTEGNVISFNDLEGVFIYGVGTNANVVAGNRIGVDPFGFALGNGFNGFSAVEIAGGASSNRIGTNADGVSDAEEGNVIAYNYYPGLVVSAGTGNTIQGNSIFGNGDLGIDLNADGVTPNDANDVDGGANLSLNFPVLTSSSVANGEITIIGTYHGAADTTFRLEFFASQTPDPTGFGEGELFLGAVNVVTDGSGNVDFEVTLPVAPPPEWAVTATATDPAGNTSEFSAAVADDIGGTIATAHTLDVAADGSAGISGTIAPAFDQDMFAYTAVADGTIEITQGAAGGSFLDSYLRVFDAAGGLIAFNDDIDYGFILDSRLQLQVVAGQTYYIQAGEFSDGTGAYDLAISAAAADEVGDTLAGAQQVELSPGGAAAVSSGIDFGFDLDVFRIEATRSGMLVIAQNAAPGSFLDSYLQVFDPAGNLLAFDDDSGGDLNSLVQLPVSAGQIIFIEAGEFFGGTGAYELSISTIDPVPDDVGNTRETAHPLPPLAVGASTSITREIETPLDVDVFQIQAAQNGTLVIAQNATVGSGLDSFLRIYDADGNLIAFDDDGGTGLDSLVNLPVQAGQAYFIHAGGYVESTGGYDLTITAGPESVDDFANAVGVAHVLPLSPARTAAIGGQIEAAFDVDLFQVQASATGILAITQGAELGSALDSFLTVYDSAGVLLAFDDDSGPGLDSRVELAVTAGQILYIQAGAFSTSTGAYALGVTPVVDDFGNVRTPDAPLIPLDGLGVGSQIGSIEAQGDVDVFRVQVPANADGMLRIRQLDRGASGLDSFLRVWDATGTLLHTFNDDRAPGSDVNSEVLLPVMRNQVFYIEAGAYFDSTGAYSVTVEMIDAQGDNVGGFFATALDVPLSAAALTRTVTHQIEVPGDSDVFRFIAPVDGMAVINLPPQAGLTAELSLFTDASNTQFSDVSGVTGAHVRIGISVGGGAAGERIEVPVLQGETYFIRVAGQSGSGPYELTVETLEGAGTLTDEQLLNSITETVLLRLREAFGDSLLTLDPSQRTEAVNRIFAAVVEEFHRAIGESIDLLQTNFLIVAFDPVDFVLNGPNGQVFASTAAGGLVDEMPNVFFGGDQFTELLIVRDYVAGQYNLTLIGTGNEARAVAAVSRGLTATNVASFAQPLDKNIAAVLDFRQATPQPDAGGSQQIAGLLTSSTNIAALLGTLLVAPGEDPILDQPPALAAENAEIQALLRTTAFVVRAADGSLLVVFNLPAGQGSFPLRIVRAEGVGGQSDGPTITALRLEVDDEGTRVVVTFDRDVDHAAAQELSGYELVWLGPDGQLGTDDDQTFALEAATYDPATHELVLRTGELPAGRYRLVLQAPAQEGPPVEPPAEDGAQLDVPGANRDEPGAALEDIPVAELRPAGREGDSTVEMLPAVGAAAFAGAVIGSRGTTRRGRREDD